MSYTCIYGIFSYYITQCCISPSLFSFSVHSFPLSFLAPFDCPPCIWPGVKRCSLRKNDIKRKQKTKQKQNKTKYKTKNRTKQNTRGPWTTSLHWENTGEEDLNFVNVFSLFHNCLPLELGKGLNPDHLRMLSAKKVWNNHSGSGEADF